MTEIKLTPLQYNTVKAISSYYKEYGSYPTLIKLLDYLREKHGYNPKSLNSVQHIVLSLKKKGIVGSGIYLKANHLI